MKYPCTWCGKKFKKHGFHPHQAHCKEAPQNRPAPKQETTSVYLEGKRQGFEDAKQDQQFRGKDAIISLAECITKLNQAFAQVVGEWRF